MSSPNMELEMKRLGGVLLAWQARLWGMYCAAAALGALWFFSLGDAWFRFPGWMRVVSWIMVAGILGAGIRRATVILSRKHSAQGVAAEVEKAFPALDNHLINFLQFSARPSKDAIVEAYLERGVPRWGEVQVEQMKNRRAHRFANCAMAAVAAVVLVTWALGGRAWAVAFWRIVNPLSATPPVTMTRIVSIEPGDTTVQKGSPLALKCKVRGKTGHEVRLDIEPADDKSRTIVLGKLAGGGDEEWDYTIAAVNAETKYRFRAGDAPFPKHFRIETRLPLAFTKADVRVEPPAYTQYKPRVFDGLAGDVEAPQGSRVRVAAQCNYPLMSFTLSTKDGEDLSPAVSGETWTAELQVTNMTSLKLTAANNDGDTVESLIGIRLIPDKAPAIQVIEPRGRTILGPGAAPTIRISVADDYGIAGVSLEQVRPSAGKDAAGEPVKRWDGGVKELSAAWTGTDIRTAPGEPLVFRATAGDNCPFADHSTRSSLIVFDVPGVQQAEEDEARALENAASALSRLIEMQKRNLDETVSLKAEIGSSQFEQWTALAGAQRKIREISGELLQNPAAPLGGMTRTVQQLYLTEMQQAVKRLEDAAGARGRDREDAAAGGIALEQTILRQLTAAAVAADKTRKERKVSGILETLAALVRGQAKVLEETRECGSSGARVAKSLVERQDDLAVDTGEFVNTCRREAPALQGADDAFAQLVLKAAAVCEEKRVKADMIFAAEKLDGNEPGPAGTHEESALAKLKEIQAMLSEWQVSSAGEKAEEMAEVLSDVKRRMDKLTDLQGKMAAAMRQIDPNLNKDSKASDMFSDEMELLLEQTREALVEVAGDLHLFPELTIGNELIEDVFSVFEEVATTVENGKGSPEEVKEEAALKFDELIDAMKEASGRIEEMEMWLASEPDMTKRVTEAFDQEELPFMALGSLENEVKDLIGDLIKADDEAARAADDGTQNHFTPDMPPGWQVDEGETVSFAAQGKSGNQVPDHVEQSGRSLVGREGMADGETAAGSGSIGKGDDEVAVRRTKDPQQSGQVQVDGGGEAKATGGGKQSSGAADELGMSGNVGKRMDSTAAGSAAGLQALLSSRGDELTVKASLLHLRARSLEYAAHHMRQADDAIAAGLPISQVQEHRKRALAELKMALTELGGGGGSRLDTGTGGAMVEDLVEGGSDDAPANYRSMVSEYFKSLNQGL